MNTHFSQRNETSPYSSDSNELDAGSTMSSSLLLGRHLGCEFDPERYRQIDEVAQQLYEVESSPDKTGLRTKLKRFWKRTRIPSVVKKVVEESKSLLSRLTSFLTPNETPPDSVDSGKKTDVPPIATVKFPQDKGPSPVSSSNPASNSDPVRATTPVKSPPVRNIPTSAPTTTPELHLTIDNKVISNPVSQAEIAREKSFSEVRYKEKKLGKQEHFPEIKIGVVSVRVKWLEPLFSGEKADDVNSSQREKEVVTEASENETEKPVQALEIHAPSGLALKVDERKVDAAPINIESDEESVFDDSPRLYKHRLPEEEPEPWVEPGIVAKRAMWLQPVMSGEKRMGSGDSDQDNRTSPTSIAHGMFG